MSLRLPSLPQVGHGAWLGAHFTGMVRTWGRLISMACVLRGIWLGNHISQHAGFNFLCQWQLWNTETLSASARSVDISVGVHDSARACGRKATACSVIVLRFCRSD